MSTEPKDAQQIAREGYIEASHTVAAAAGDPSGYHAAYLLALRYLDRIAALPGPSTPDVPVGGSRWVEVGGTGHVYTVDAVRLYVRLLNEHMRPMTEALSEFPRTFRPAPKVSE